ncbi:MAG: MFS transporter [Candidatus Saccharibacteria bacterium]
MAGTDFKDVPSELKRNFRLLCTFNFFNAASFTLPIYILFGTHYLHITYLEAGSFFLTSWFLSLALDFIGGTMADKYGRKRTFTIGLLLQILGVLPFIFIKNYPLLLAAAILTGFGMALYTNTVSALFYEQAIELKRKAYYQHANPTMLSFSYLGRIMASIVGGIAFKIHPTLPYILTASSLALGLVAGLGTKFSATVEAHMEHKSVGGVSGAALRVFTSNPALLKFILVVGLLCAWGDYAFTYYQPYFIQHGATSTTLGYLFAAISLFSAIGTLAMRKLPNRLSAQRINSITLSGVILTGLLLAVLHLPAAYGAPLVMALISGLTLPNLSLYVNKFAPNRIRSSVLSIATTAMGIGSGVGIFTALRLVGHVSQHTILLVLTVGAVATLLLNTGFNFRDQASAKA